MIADDMTQNLTLDGKTYNVNDLSNEAKSKFVRLQFVNIRLEELNNMNALLQRAKNSYVDGLKKEMLANKAGLLFE
jgi:hypothetical protein